MSNIDQQRPKVGIGVMVLKEGRVLLGKRKGSHGEGEYCFPGGHLEHLESFEECAERETKEECGINITNIQFQLVSNALTYAPKHYVHIGMTADWKSGEPELVEPDKFESWGWYALDDLPSPLFKLSKIALDGYRSGKVYYGLVE